MLQACDPSRNIRRHWHIELRRDLFGWIVVEWRWGRIGTAGQSRSLAFEQEGRRGASSVVSWSAALAPNGDRGGLSAR
ncbi:WGR domain-containing protein [Sphingobium scionense]